MKPRMPRLVLFPVVAAAICLGAAAGSSDLVPYPSGYRGWTHVKSMVILEGHPLYESFGGIHHLYANALAMKGYRIGVFPHGATIVFDLLEANNADHAITEGQRKIVGVMVKDHEKYRATGGWGFEGFKGDSKTERAVGSNAATACFGCHAAQQKQDYVFSRYRN